MSMNNSQSALQRATDILLQHKKEAKEFIKFGVVGGSGVLVNIGIYLLLTRVTGIVYYIGSPLAIELSILWNFVWNNSWTFKKRETSVTGMTRLVRFHAVSCASGVANYVILLLCVMLFGLWDILANMIGIGFGTVINYYMNSAWTWREVPEKSSFLQKRETI